MPGYGAFQRLSDNRVESCAFRLRIAEDIPQHCLQYVDASTQWSFWRNSLGFQFGTLTKPQWQLLVQRYWPLHQGHFLLPYDASHHYELLDFMPPAIQALNRHRFIAETRSLSPKHEAQIVTNCWGTIYEILRLSRFASREAPVLLVTEAKPMLNLFRHSSRPIKTASIQPGDLLLILHRHGDREYLDHTAIAIDQQVIFEKAGMGDRVPYRFVDLNTTRQIWNPQIFTYEWRRPIPSHSLQHPLQQFRVKHPIAQISLPYTMTYSMDGKTIYFPAITLPPLRRQGSQFQLPPEAY